MAILTLELMSDNGGHSGATLVDVVSPWARRTLASARPRGALGLPPTPELRPVATFVSPGNTMKSASLAEVLRRETIVRRNRALEVAAETPRAPDHPPASERGPPGPVRVPIDWARGDDRGQRIQLLGRDGFRIHGVGAGPRRLGSEPRLALAVGGVIHRVSVTLGASPGSSLERLLLDLRERYLVEIKEFSGLTAAARIVGLRAPHT